MGSGYWAYKIPRPDRESNEAVCVNPAQLSGQSFLTPLLNLDYLLAPPPGDVETAFWNGYPDAVTASCDREGTKHWLNVDFNGVPDPFLTAVIPFVASGINWHVPEVNVAEENLIQIAGLQSASYVASERAAVVKKRSAVRKQLKAAKKKSKKLSKRARKARKLCASKGKGCSKAKKLRKKSKKAQRRVSSLKKRERALTREIRSLVVPAA